MLATTAAGSARRFDDRPVVDAPDGRLTYAELDARSGEVAAGLAARGVAAGDVVAIVVPPGGDWLVLAVATNRLGAVFAGISTALSAPERAAQVALVRPRLVVAVPETADGLPLRSQVAVIGAGRRGRELRVSDAAPPPNPPAPAPPPPDPDRRVAICFTSGTTGRAKAAVFCERQLAAVRRIDLGPAEHEWGGGTDMLASTQFAHVGMTLKLPWYLQLGATLHVVERWRADDALRLVATHRMPTIGVVAPQLALMLRSPLMDSLDLTSVRSIIAGGAASPPSLVAEARERFRAAYSIRYSSTESGGVGLGTAFDAPDDEALHTVGRPRQGVEVRIADDSDAAVPDGEIGELQLRSEAVMEGYLDDPRATGAALTSDRWLRTGDLAKVRADGAVVLAGRRTDMYIRGGYNVFPEEVEAVLVAHPAVRALAIVPRPDEVMGEVGTAVVVPADASRPPTLEDLRGLGAHSLARHKLPEALVLVDELPLTGAQKLDRAVLRARLGTGEVQDPPAAADGSG